MHDLSHPIQQFILRHKIMDINGNGRRVVIRELMALEDVFSPDGDRVLPLAKGNWLHRRCKEDRQLLKHPMVLVRLKGRQSASISSPFTSRVAKAMQFDSPQSPQLVFGRYL